MSRHPSHAPPPYAQRVAQKLFSAIERFLHVEAVGGAVLLHAAAAALAWANSPMAATYHGFWDTPVTIGIGDFALTGTAHYVVNEVLMTIFFLVVGMEIRRELHDGALSNPRAAAFFQRCGFEPSDPERVPKVKWAGRRAPMPLVFWHDL